MLADVASKDSSLPSPGNDGLPLGELPFTFVFGCLDLGTLKRWFCPGNSVAEDAHIVCELKGRGFVLAEFLVVDPNDCWTGLSGTQVAFYPSDSVEEGLVQFHELEMLLGESKPFETVH
jgi:hypothetical protein